MDWEALYEAARQARERSYSPYSRFQVGAALLLPDGGIIAGCNVENRSFGLAVCAERTALVQAVAQGHREFLAIAVVTDTDPPATPCGMCLESLTEFCEDLPILVANLNGERRHFQLRELHPAPFEWPEDLS